MGAWRDDERDVPTCSKIWKGVGREGVGERELREEKEGGPTEGGSGGWLGPTRVRLG